MKQIKRGDLEPELEIALTRDGAPVDLTPAQSVNVVMLPRARGAAVRRIATGGATGVVKMPWVAGDTDAPGLIDLEVEVTWPVDRPETFPEDGYLTVEVVPDLG